MCNAAAMLGFLHVIHIESGVRFPGYISGSAELKFTDVPAGLIASLEAIPKLGWLQVLAVALACETGYAGRAFSVVRQEPDREVRPGLLRAATQPPRRNSACAHPHQSAFRTVLSLASRSATSAARGGCATRTRKSRPTS